MPSTKLYNLFYLEMSGVTIPTRRTFLQLDKMNETKVFALYSYFELLQNKPCRANRLFFFFLE